MDGDDAVPTDDAVDWRKTSGHSYVWIPFENLPAGAGSPLDINDAGSVLLEGAVWKDGCSQALNLAEVFPFSGQPDPGQTSAPESFTAVPEAIGEPDGNGVPAILGHGVGANTAGGDWEGPVVWGSASSTPQVFGFNLLVEGTATGDQLPGFLPARAPRAFGPFGRVLVVDVQGGGGLWFDAASPEGAAAGQVPGAGWSSLTAALPDGSVLGQIETPAASGQLRSRIVLPGGSQHVFSDWSHWDLAPTPGGRWWLAGINATAQTVGVVVRTAQGAWKESQSLAGVTVHVLGGNGEALCANTDPDTATRLWRNGGFDDLSAFVPAEDLQDLVACGIDINASGTILVGLRSASAAPGSGYLKAGVLVPVNLLANTNRDTDAQGKEVIDSLDEQGKDGFTRQRGALFSVNFDDDDGDGQADGALWWDYAGGPTSEDHKPRTENWVIENDADTKDITRFSITLGQSLPQGMKVFLTVGSEAEMQAIHLFGDIQPGAKAFWGGCRSADRPWTNQSSVATEIEITGLLNPAADSATDTPESRSARPAKKGEYVFGIEGVALAGMHLPEGNGVFVGKVDLGLKVLPPRNGVLARVPNAAVRLRVAPWLLAPNDRPTERVFVTEGLGLEGIPKAVEVPSSDPVPNRMLDRWKQDEVEIGYTQSPGTPCTTLTFVTPHKAPASVSTSGLAHWSKEVAYGLFGPDHGVFGLGFLAAGNENNFGGNIELLPAEKNAPLGRVVYGSANNGMPIDPKLTTFLGAQDAQLLFQPKCPVFVGFTHAGHVDEVLSPGPGGLVYYPDPKAGMDLLAASFPGDADKLAGCFFAKGETDRGRVAHTFKAVAQAGHMFLIVDADFQAAQNAWAPYVGGYLRLVNKDTPWGGQIARISAVAAALHAPGDGYDASINGKVRIEVDRVWRAAGGSKAQQEWDIVDWTEQNDAWITPPPANADFVCVRGPVLEWQKPFFITVKELLADDEFRNFNEVVAPAKIAAVIQAAKLSKTKGVPTIYFRRGLPESQDPKLISFTPNPINGQWADGVWWQPKPYGPRGGGGAEAPDVIEESIKALFPPGGATVFFVHDWENYHLQTGEVHCGSAAERTPEPEWWKKFQPVPQP